MKALVYDEYSTDDDFSKILKIKDIPLPTPKSNEVIFKVESAALTYDAIWAMRGKPFAISLPHISGTDVAGNPSSDVPGKLTFLDGSPNPTNQGYAKKTNW